VALYVPTSSHTWGAELTRMTVYRLKRICGPLSRDGAHLLCLDIKLTEPSSMGSPAASVFSQSCFSSKMVSLEATDLEHEVDWTSDPGQASRDPSPQESCRLVVGQLHTALHLKRWLRAVTGARHSRHVSNFPPTSG